MEYSFSIVIIVFIVRFQFNIPWSLFLVVYRLHFFSHFCFTFFNTLLGRKNLLINSKVRNIVVMRPSRITFKVSCFSTIMEVMPWSTLNRRWSIIRIRFCKRLNSLSVSICVCFIIFHWNFPCFSWFFWFQYMSKLSFVFLNILLSCKYILINSIVWNSIIMRP